MPIGFAPGTTTMSASLRGRGRGGAGQASSTGHGPKNVTEVDSPGAVGGPAFALPRVRGFMEKPC